MSVVVTIDVEFGDRPAPDPLGALQRVRDTVTAHRAPVTYFVQGRWAKAYPDLVAQRILRFAEIVGRERVIASTDCGMGGRIHPDIAWAKFEALAQGARIASKTLWR